MKSLKYKGMYMVDMLLIISIILFPSNIIFVCTLALWIVVLILFLKDTRSIFLRLFYLLLITGVACYAIFILKYHIFK